MADLLPVEVPEDFSRAKNRDHEGNICPIPSDMKFTYGTAGFRQKAQYLTFIVFRMGYLAGLRARELNKSVGVMITASHNPALDNGVKIIDPMGEMLATDWEKFASELVNTSDEQLPTAVRALEVQTATQRPAQKARVICAIDTRSSGPHLFAAAKAGVLLMGVEFVNHGILTTPQLHFIVRSENDPGFAEPNELGYYARLSDAFKELYQMMPTPEPPSYSTNLFLDCANGVGAQKMRMLQRFLPQDAITISYRNEFGELNHNCGADFVKIGQKLPDNFKDVTSISRCASFDGDADRLVYFRNLGSDDKVILLDGDRIAVLIVKYLKEALHSAGLDHLTLGVVQTAYANGNSTRYLAEQLGVTPIFVPTGVKHLHHAALQFDIGVYFEANGHGTVLFSDRFKESVSIVACKNPAARRLQLISRVINEVVGDAMADLLAVELILRWYGWNVTEWEQQLYYDIPSVQIKVPVTDRSVYKTTFEETILLEPIGIQDKINEHLKHYKKSRAFVRPSGTENIVRVYAEAENPEDAAQLAQSISGLVKKEESNRE